MADLNGRIAVVTGASRGIGKGIALALGERGCTVYVTGRTVGDGERTIDTTAREVSEAGGEGRAIQCDHGDDDQIAALFERIGKEVDHIDILVNNAGGWPPKPTLDVSDSEFDACFRFNVTTAFAMAKVVVSKMVETTGGGAIVNISSAAGRFNARGFAAYGTAKSALSFLTKSLAQDFAPKIRVNGIAVGSILTEALSGFMTDELERQMLAKTPMGRLGQVEDIAACALYLASPAASYVTGEIYGVNGGLTQIQIEMPPVDL